MTVRITTHRQGRKRIIRVDGWLSADSVATLHDLIGPAPRGVRVELSGLRSADEASLAALCRLRAAGVELSGMSPYLTLMLDSTSDDAGPGAGGGRPFRPREG